MNKLLQQCGITIPLILLFLAFASPFYAQKKAITNDKVAEYEQRTKQLVEYLEGTLNFIGDPKSTTREKETIINGSFTKIFRDKEVQIEDDLDESRITPINKDIQAYLKDIDFFFKKAQFDFNIEGIKQSFNDNNQIFFKVELTRNLKAISINGDTINTNRKRFIEVNLDEKSNDLKIASIYTTRLNEGEELKNWWISLPASWKDVFLTQISASDSLTIQNIKSVTQITSLDISSNPFIDNLTPLSELSNLTYLDCSSTKVNSLFPLRSLANIEYLDCSNSSVSDLSPLTYSVSLKHLDFKETYISDLQILENFTKLEYLNAASTPINNISQVSNNQLIKELNISNTAVSDIEPLSKLTKIEKLDVSKTNINTISAISNLQNLVSLNIDYTSIDNLSALQTLKNLEELSINHTLVISLTPLLELPKLKKVFCDNSYVSREEANRFMDLHKTALVVYESEVLNLWWSTMAPEWKSIFGKIKKLSSPPTKEELHEIANIEELVIKNNSGLLNIEPLSQLQNLKTLIITNAPIQDISPLNNLEYLETLDISNSKITSLVPLSRLIRLKTINVANTKVNDLEPLAGLYRLNHLDIDYCPITSLSYISELTSLKTLIADSTNIPKEEFLNLVKKNPLLMAVFRSQELKEWWYTMPESWRKVFKDSPGEPNRTELHQYTYLSNVDINNNSSIKTLQPLHKMVLIKTLSFSGTQVSDLSPISELFGLIELSLPNNPVENLVPISGLTNLEVLNLENNPIKDLEIFRNYSKIKDLNIAGTRIKRLNGLENLSGLQNLSCFNTKIRTLNPLMKLTDIKTLKCYNTKISASSLKKFKSRHPNCEVLYY